MSPSRAVAFQAPCCLRVAREPDPYLDSFTGLVAARALTTAALLGVFDALHEQPGTAEELAERLSLDPLGADTLLTTLLTLGYVEPAQRARCATAR